MEIDLEKGISFKIEGELGKYQTLPIDALVKIAQSFQNLVLSIAKNDVSSEDAIDFNNFKIELADFKKGSAIPSFIYTPRIQHTISDYQKQRTVVNSKLTQILNIADKGDYKQIKDYYPSSSSRNDIVESLYEFTKSFRGSPITISDKEDLSLNFRIKRFKPEVKTNLITKITNVAEEKTEHSAIARVKVTTKGKKSSNKIEEIISEKGHSISYSPDIVNVSEKQYILFYPLRCSFEKEEDYYIIKNELIDIIATGLTIEEAETNFNEEFDFLYTRLNQLDNSKLSPRMQNIKTAINLFVKEVN
jgi:predicted RNase H-like HicB family nuclease